MKKTLVSALAFSMLSAAVVSGAALLSGSALAADSMAATFGNTVVAKQADGSTSKVWYKADKTFSAVDAKGVKMSGTWDVAGGKVCSTQKDPAPAAGMEKQCGPEFPAGKKAGDSWDVTADSGVKYSLSIVAGAQ